VHCQNETLTNNLINALFAFVEGNHEEMSAEMIEQLHAVQQGLESQQHVLEDIEDQVDEIEDLAFGGSERCAGVIVSGHCVILHNQRYNIHTANDTCVGKDQMLAKIFTEHEYNVVMEYVRSTDVITDRSLVYVWTAMDLEGFPPRGDGTGPPGRDDHDVYYYPEWLPSYPRRNPNFEYVAWQIVSNPMFGDSGFMNVPAEATAYPLCAYHVDDETEETTTTEEYSTTSTSSTTTTTRRTTTTTSEPTTTTAEPTTTTDESTTAPARCGEDLSGSYGVLQSPNYPQNYDNHHRCEWTITVPEDEVDNFEISFISFSIEPHNNCQYDFIALYDGPSRESPLLGIFCGSNHPENLRPTSSVVTVYFFSDASETFMGFLLSWSTAGEGTTAIPSTLQPESSTANERDCGGRFVESSGTLSSPNYPENYGNRHDCTWQIVVPEGEIVYVEFQSFDVENDEYCEYDNVKLYDGELDHGDMYNGTHESSLIIARLCGSTVPDQVYASSGNVMSVHFYSDGTVTGAGWLLSWTTDHTPETTTTTEATTTTTQGPTTTGAERQCGRRQDLSRKVKRDVKELVEMLGPEMKIVGGEDSQRGDWPWQIGYAIIQGSSYGIVCGGTLIAPGWVITAAHCTYASPSDGSASVIVVGEHDLTVTETSNSRKDCMVSQIINHQEYNDNTYENDISLVKLAGEVPYSDYIQPACLPSQGSEIPVGTECWITGWGETQSDPAEVMQAAQVPIVNNNDCQNWSGLRIIDTMVCAGYQEGGIDSCQGDSGGPLVCQSGASFVLQGVTSHGIGCAEPNRPGVYTRMSEFVTWTEETMSSQINEPLLFSIPTTECGTMITSEQIIRLPVDEATQAYTSNMDCSWTVQPPAGTATTTLTFVGERFHIEQNTATSCYDILEVTKAGQRIRLFCGNTIPNDLTIPGEDSFQINFRSDNSAQFEGFAAGISFA